MADEPCGEHKLPSNPGVRHDAGFLMHRSKLRFGAAIPSPGRGDRFSVYLATGVPILAEKLRVEVEGAFRLGPEAGPWAPRHAVELALERVRVVRVPVVNVEMYPARAVDGYIECHDEPHRRTLHPGTWVISLTAAVVYPGELVIVDFDAGLNGFSGALNVEIEGSAAGER